MVLHDDLHVGVADRFHLFNVFRSVNKSLDMVLQSMSDQIPVSSLSRKEEKILPTLEITMLSLPAYPLFALVGRDNRLSDLVHCLKIHAMTFKQEFNGQFLQGQTCDIAREMHWTQFMQYVRLSKSCCYTSLARLICKNNNVFTCVTEQSKRSSSGHAFGLV